MSAVCQDFGFYLILTLFYKQKKPYIKAYKHLLTFFHADSVMHTNSTINFENSENDGVAINNAILELLLQIGVKLDALNRNLDNIYSVLEDIQSYDLNDIEKNL